MLRTARPSSVSSPKRRRYSRRRSTCSRRLRRGVEFTFEEMPDFTEVQGRPIAARPIMTASTPYLSNAPGLRAESILRANDRDMHSGFRFTSPIRDQSPDRSRVVRGYVRGSSVLQSPHPEAFPPALQLFCSRHPIPVWFSRSPAEG